MQKWPEWCKENWAINPHRVVWDDYRLAELNVKLARQYIVHHPRKKSVIGQVSLTNIKTGEVRVYPSTIAASRALGVTASMVSNLRQGKARSTQGWSLTFDTGVAHRPRQIPIMLRRGEEVREFESLKEAGLALHISTQTIREMMRGLRASSARGWGIVKH